MVRSDAVGAGQCRQDGSERMSRQKFQNRKSAPPAGTKAFPTNALYNAILGVSGDEAELMVRVRASRALPHEYPEDVKRFAALSVDALRKGDLHFFKRVLDVMRRFGSCYPGTHADELGSRLLFTYLPLNFRRTLGERLTFRDFCEVFRSADNPFFHHDGYTDKELREVCKTLGMVFDPARKPRS